MAKGARRVKEARSILTDLGLPKEQINDRSALTLLALLGLGPAEHLEQGREPRRESPEAPAVELGEFPLHEPAEHGAIGCLIYSDPKDDGYYPGDTYPHGPFRPKDGVQRGSVMDMAVHPAIRCLRAGLPKRARAGS